MAQFSLLFILLDKELILLKKLLLTLPMRCFFCGAFVLFLSCVCYALAHYLCLVVTCWERADLLALVCDFLYCVCHFPMLYPVSDVMIVLITDLCPLSYFYYHAKVCHTCVSDEHTKTHLQKPVGGSFE